MQIEEEIRIIKERNLRVESDKAWEVSTFRKVLITGITYVIASIALYAIGVSDFYLGAIVPTLGFLLSTLTLSVVKRWWLKRFLAQSLSTEAF
jgi:hypothetical protein